MSFDEKPLPLFVLAGTFDQARRWAKEKGLAFADWRYVHDVRDTYGHRGAKYVRVGTYWENAHAPTDAELAAAGMVEAQP